MRVLVTGANGFIGRHLVEGLAEEHSVTSLTRGDVELTSRQAVDSFFATNSFDVVLHTAFMGGDPSSEYCCNTHENLLMVYNLLANKHKFKYLLSFGSGAELREDSFPTKPYALSKNVIARLLEPLPYAYNLRVYGCFGFDEPERRFFRSNIRRNIEGLPMEITQNKLFSTIYVNDLVEVVLYYIHFLDKKDLPKTLDCCYDITYDLYSMAEMINEHSQKQSEITALDLTLGDDYVGNGAPLAKLKIPLKGLEAGIAETIKRIEGEYQA